MSHAEDTHDNLDSWWQRKYDAMTAERDRAMEAAKMLRSLVAEIDRMHGAAKTGDALDDTAWLDDNKGETK